MLTFCCSLRSVYSEIKAVLVVRDQDFRKKLIDDVRNPRRCLLTHVPVPASCPDLFPCMYLSWMLFHILLCCFQRRYLHAHIELLLSLKGAKKSTSRPCSRKLLSVDIFCCYFLHRMSHWLFPQGYMSKGTGLDELADREAATMVSHASLLVKIRAGERYSMDPPLFLFVFEASI